MRKVKTWVALMLVFAMVGIAVGCSKNVSKKTEDGNPTLTWILPGDKQADLASVIEKVNKIIEPTIGAKLDLQFYDGGAFSERMKMNMASSSDFDLCFTGYINPYVQAAKKGGYLAIDDYLKGSKMLEALPDYAIKSATIDGKIYGIPNLQIMTGCTGLFIQKDLADRYGLKPENIKCLEDIEPFLAWVKENEPNIYPFRTGQYGGGLRGVSFVESPARGVVAYAEADGSMTVIPEMERASFLNQPKLIRSWYEKGYIRTDVASVTDDTQEHNAGKFAVWRGTFKPGGIEEYNNSPNTKKAICIQISEPYMMMGAGLAAMTAVGVNSKHPKLAVKMLEMVNTDKRLYNLLCFGIEGKHYNMNEDNRVEYIENSGYAPKASWKFGNQFNAYLLPGQRDDVWEKTIEFHNSAKKMPLLGFKMNTDPIRTEIAQIETVIGKYKSLDTGAEPLENYLETYKKEMYAAGVEKVAEEARKQIKEWQSKNKTANE